jgi:hypothetical protein
VNFALGSAQCSDVTDLTGIATCQLVPSVVGMGTLTATFAGTSAFVASNDSVGFNVMAAQGGTGGRTLTSLNPATLWIGLKNSDDQGTQFDLRAEVYKNGTPVPVAAGQTLCITGVTRNPDQAKQVTVSFSPFTPAGVASGGTLSLKILTRIGTNANGTKCSGPGGSHNNAVGLRLYYDAGSRPSRFESKRCCLLIL